MSNNRQVPPFEVITKFPPLRHLRTGKMRNKADCQVAQLSQ
jgi:hypothetical protein